MIELYRWLGDLNGINTLSLFEINHHEYFQPNSNREMETKRLEGNIKISYRKLMLKLHPDQQQQFPDSFKELSQELYNEVNLVYELLTNKEKYKNPDPHDGRHNLPGYISTTLETFTLTSYVLSLQHNQPDELPLVGTIKKFIHARDDLEQMLLSTNRSFMSPLPPHDPLPPTEYIEMIEERDRLLKRKDEENTKLKEERNKQREMTEAYREQLVQAVNDRHSTSDLLSKMELELEKILEQ